MWAADWRHAQGLGREARLLPPTAAAFRQLLTPIDRRLAGIERHLGIAGDEETAPGFRGLLMSVNRHLASIERHLGIAGDDEAGEEGPQKEADRGRLNRSYSAGRRGVCAAPRGGLWGRSPPMPGGAGGAPPRKINCLVRALEHRLNCSPAVREGFCHVLAQCRSRWLGPPVSSARHP